MSLHLAMNNLTQIEKLGTKTKVHILAVLKPSQEELIQIRPYETSQYFYPEITYPLGTGFPVITSNDYTRTPQSAQTAANTPPSTGPPMGSPEAAQYPSVPAPIRELLTPQEGNQRHNEALSARDSRATRTFAILRMLKPGDNPWDLGSALLNLETVMGTDILDWVLPIRRSPCCNHESPESQFRLGPKVDLLRVAFYLKEPKDIPLPKGARKQSVQRTGPADQEKSREPANDFTPNEPNTIPMAGLNDYP